MKKAFSSKPERYFSAPGRTEIGGNHTDHQRGRVLAAAVNLDAVAAVRMNGTDIIRIQSKGYPLCEVDIRSDEVLCKHADWIENLKKQYTFTADNAREFILKETGKVFSKVLEDAGVYKNTEDGRNAFLRFISYINQAV